MSTIRNAVFALMCLVALMSAQQKTNAATFDDWQQCSIYDDTIGGCEFAILYGDKICEYDGYCPFAVGCDEALFAACYTCSGDEYVCVNLRAFDCENPLEGPTDFSFRCDFNGGGPYWY